MKPGNFKTDQLIFKPIKTLGKDNDTCRFMPIKIKCDDNEKDLLFVTEKLFFSGRKNLQSIKAILYHCVFGMKRKTLKILFPRKENYCKLFKLLKKNVKNISRRRKLNTPWKIKVYYHVYLIQIKN